MYVCTSGIEITGEKGGGVALEVLYYDQTLYIDYLDYFCASQTVSATFVCVN